MPKFNWLRSLGPVGSGIADGLAILTTNWPIVMSIVVGLATGGFAWLRAIALNPVTYTSVGTFLVTLWTVIGVFALIDRRRPLMVRTHLDYRYGLTFEGFQPYYLDATADVPNAGSLSFLASLRNFSPGPIRYEAERFDIRIGSRSSEEIKKGELTGFMARGAGRTSRNTAFPPAEIKEFYGKEVKGTARLSFVYGPPDGPPLRRLKIEIEITLILKNDGSLPFGYGDNIIQEVDEPI